MTVNATGTVVGFTTTGPGARPTAANMAGLTYTTGDETYSVEGLLNADQSVQERRMLGGRVDKYGSSNSWGDITIVLNAHATDPLNAALRAAAMTANTKGYFEFALPDSSGTVQNVYASGIVTMGGTSVGTADNVREDTYIVKVEDQF